MADLRLLGRRYAPLLVALVTGCAVGPVWACGVKGRVVDGESGRGVPDALVLVVYDQVHPDGNLPVDVRWTMTDESGRFEIPGRWSIHPGPVFSRTSDPFVTVMHEDYGIHVEPEAEFERINGRMEISPDGTSLYFREHGGWASLCSGLTIEACDRVCEAFPSACSGRPSFE